MKVVIVEPGKPAYEKDVMNALKPLQDIVGGYIEVLPSGGPFNPLDNRSVLICNEEGKLLGLPLNRQIGFDVICGTFIIAGDGGEDFCSLDDAQVQHYCELFKDTEVF